MRVHELAKELNVSSKELIERLQKLHVDVKNHMSVLAPKDVEAAKKSLAPAAPVAPKKETKETPAVSAPAQAAAPAKKAPGATQTPSIESVKQAFLAQRLGARSSPTPEVKRPAPSAPVRRPMPPVSTPAPVQRPAPRPEHRRPAPVPTAAPVVSTPAPVAAPEPVRTKALYLDPVISVKDLADKLMIRPNDLIARLIKLGVFASINQTITFDVASKILPDLGYEPRKTEAPSAEASSKSAAPAADNAKLKPRAPVVTFMGHVDHGKTSLLDAIRKTKVAAGEAGGITQHIGAYEVFLEKGAVTFLDTPGHEAFTAMRARGARATDVVVLVVAADDGVMPQTIEAIDHAKAAGVPIVVAMNKIDLPAANPDRVKKALMEHGLMPEDWGGKTIVVPVSAKTGKGIDQLLEMLALESDLLELKADPDQNATGVVIEAELSKGSGVLATVLVQDGTLRVGDTAVVGSTYGKIRAMINDRGQRVKEALPSMPVAILGLPVVPKAGDRFEVVRDERVARERIEKMGASAQADSGDRAAHVTLEHLYEDVKSGKVGSLKLVLKSDVQGSIEALRNTLATIQSKNVKLDIIHTAIGDVSESDVMLAAASNAVVIGFHVGMSSAVRETAEREGVDVRFYEIIYEIKTAIEKSMEGLLEPEMKEVAVGTAEVRQVFKVSKVGVIAGCSVQKGKIVRNFPCRVVRNGQKIHEGKVVSLKRFKDDAREVLEGYECGIGVSNFDDLAPGDRIEVFEIQKKARKLE